MQPFSLLQRRFERRSWRAASRRAVHVLLHPQAVVVTGVGRCAAPADHLAQLPAADPRAAPRAVAGQVSLRVIAQIRPVVLGQLVLPVAVTVSIQDGSTG